ncbi:MAG: permease [Chloroflexi bacterium GWB2_54_36]|nr:MAG: permease [Chloroflexi bacterium GWB2_54_36]
MGRPLPTADAPHQTIGIMIGLAVFASDALSSSAYGTQEMLVILAALGSGAYQYVFPLSLAIIVLLAIVVISYEQTIHAYPNGGGSYIVSRDNLGELPAKIAAAALLTDYILTVAVSISSGVANLVSAVPSLLDYRVWLAISMVVFIMLVNLRGVRESGNAIAIPTYFFIVATLLALGVGLFKYLSGSLGTVVDPPLLETVHVTQGAIAFLLLRAFSSGTSALTGVEAVSNGIPAFKVPRSKNAGITLIIMSIILAAMTLGISFLTSQIHAIPSEEETVISQIVRTAYGNRGLLYLATVVSTMIILILAANTSFAGFPRLSAIVALDGFMPRQLAYRGSRLVYSNGIVLLAIIAAVLILAFNASVTRLIPLYAIGVFLSFTLSQFGMARRWKKIGSLKEGAELKERGSTLRYEKGWQFKMIINGIGAVLTGIVMLVFAVTKFAQGAWLVIIIIPLLVILFSGIRRHYSNLASDLSLENQGTPPQVSRQRVILPLSGVHRGTLAALRYARTLSDDITAVHVSIDPEETARLQQKWETWGDGHRLVILESQYRTFIEPLLEYIDEIDNIKQPKEVITIVVPEFVPRHWWSNILHTKTAATLSAALHFRKDIIITNVPYQVD